MSGILVRRAAGLVTSSKAEAMRGSPVCIAARMCMRDPAVIRIGWCSRLCRHLHHIRHNLFDWLVLLRRSDSGDPPPRWRWLRSESNVCLEKVNVSFCIWRHFEAKGIYIIRQNTSLGCLVFVILSSMPANLFYLLKVVTDIIFSQLFTWINIYRLFNSLDIFMSYSPNVDIWIR